MDHLWSQKKMGVPTLKCTVGYSVMMSCAYFVQQDYLFGAALLSVCQECSLPTANLQSQERLDFL